MDVEYVSRYQFRIILTQGLNRQIRRMCEFLGYEVERLIRTRIMHLGLEGLKPGKWRDLSSAELARLNLAVKDSVKTYSGNKAPTKAKKKAPTKQLVKQKAAKSSSAEQSVWGQVRANKSRR